MNVEPNTSFDNLKSILDENLINSFQPHKDNIHSTLNHKTFEGFYNQFNIFKKCNLT